MAKNDNLTDFLVDVADAIREKKGISGPINPQDFASEIASIESGGGNGWTGHADAEGLRAIGWTEEDIAYYQENGVDWNEEDDHLHVVSDDNKALYGVLTPYNISTYKDRIVYLPKIDFSGITTMSYRLYQCYNLLAIPRIDTSSAVEAVSLFMYCYNLRSVPPLDFSNATNLRYAFYQCFNLSKVEITNTSLCSDWRNIFFQCSSLKQLSKLNVANATTLMDTFNQCVSLEDIEIDNSSGIKEWKQAFYFLSNIRSIRGIDMLSATEATTNMLSQANKCEDLTIYNLSIDIEIQSYAISKASLVDTIDNAVDNTAITIKLRPIVYDTYINDTDVVEALANHPNITLAK